MGYFIGILDGDKDVWGVRIPDFPGIHGGGATPEEAIADATSALREIAALYIAEGRQIPQARPVLEVTATCVGKGEAAVMIPLLLDQGRSVRANLSLDAGMLQTIDQEAARRGLSRSAFLTSAAIDKIQAVNREALYFTHVSGRASPADRERGGQAPKKKAAK